MYGIAIKNPNDSFMAQFPPFNITGRAEDGSIVFNDEQVCNAIYPGETIYYGFQAGDGVAPATVEFSLQKPNWEKEGKLDGDMFSIANTSEVDNGYGMMSFTGEVSTNVDLEAESYTQVAMTVITRDDSGAINYGMTNFVDVPEKGQSIPFDVSAYSVPVHASYELHAQLW